MYNEHAVAVEPDEEQTTSPGDNVVVADDSQAESNEAESDLIVGDEPLDADYENDDQDDDDD